MHVDTDAAETRTGLSTVSQRSILRNLRSERCRHVRSVFSTAATATEVIVFHGVDFAGEPADAVVADVFAALEVLGLAHVPGRARCH